eukprot:TRINITY_DN6263_c1_g1_i1.p6 TRINITY_DN6263_c1_g1~~TRINITY_DN6263_c1_g1_i1.p6  ORF type:complete len:123 (+),score=4.32 TRINITY_DN6263_c1_g1_i1:356-724(+)
MPLLLHPMRGHNRDTHRHRSNHTQDNPHLGRPELADLLRAPLTPCTDGNRNDEIQQQYMICDKQLLRYFTHFEHTSPLLLIIVDKDYNFCFQNNSNYVQNIRGFFKFNNIKDLKFGLLQRYY